MTNTIPCPQPGDHGTSCLCNGSRELIVRAKTSLCPTCGDAEAQRNLGNVANHLGRPVGAACKDCGTVGDVAEYERRRVEAEALRGPEAAPVASEFSRAVGLSRQAPAYHPPAPADAVTIGVDPAVIAEARSLDDDAIIEHLKTAGVYTAEAAHEMLVDLPSSRAAVIAELTGADADHRRRVFAALDDLDRAERIARRILSELG